MSSLAPSRWTAALAVGQMAFASAAFVGAPCRTCVEGATAAAAMGPRASVSMKGFTISSPGAMTRDERLNSRYGGFLFEPEDDMGAPAAEEVGFSYEDMAASMEEIKSFSRGDVCVGTVLGFEPNGALVDIGVKSSAYVAIGEAALVKPDRIESALEIGVEYEFLIVSREDENGQMSLSRRRILTELSWETVAQMMTEDQAVDATVSAVNRGGAMLTVEGLRAFLPGSHYLPGQNPPEDLVGSTLKVKFLDVDKDNNRLVVSHRKAMVDQTITSLTVGAVMQGIVTAVKPYGAFIDLGGMSGLLHISQISCDHIGDVGSVLPMGTVIKCMVISQDKGKGRVALSTKTLEAEPGDMINNPQKVFDEADATAAKYQERLEAEKKAREEAAQDVIFGLESVFDDTKPADAPAAAKSEGSEELPFEG